VKDMERTALMAANFVEVGLWSRLEYKIRNHMSILFKKENNLVSYCYKYADV